MNGLTEKLINNYTPCLALVVYAADDNWHEAYIESHVINDKGQMLEGKPLQQETIQGLVDVFFDERKNKQTMSGIFPHNLICFEHRRGGSYKMIWHRPAERRVLHFNNKLHIPTGEAWVPAMLYVADGKHLDVFALVTDERPDENTKLYRAPYHNVSEDGDVCLGSAKVKKPRPQTYTSVMKYWEDMFWLSEFTHITGSESPVKGNINTLWAQLVENPKMNWSQFDELLPSEITFNQIFK